MTSRYKCSVKGCERKKSPMHRFPNNDSHRLKLWLEATGNPHLATYTPAYLSKNKVICSKHFESKYKLSGKRLAITSIPTLFLPERPNDELPAEPNEVLESNDEEMVLRCCVPNCDGEGYSKRAFPRWHMGMYKIWVERIQNQNLTMDLDPSIAYKRYRVCDRHFEDICHVPGETRLKRDSLPTLNLPPGYQRQSDADALFYTLEKQQAVEKANETTVSEEEVECTPADDDKKDEIRFEDLSREELIEKVRSLHAENQQLKNSINKQTSNEKTKTQKPFDFSKCNFRHILLKFYYLGWNYNGYVVQEDTENTIEHHLFKALMKTCLIKDRASSNYHRCGRTDKGVSSFGQTISIDVRSKLAKIDQHEVDREIDYCVVLNKVLPPDIQCISWCPAEENYSARFNCSSRTYRYFFPKGNLNITKMDRAASFLVGTHDYRNFCKMDVANGVIEFVRRIDKFEIVALDPFDERTEYSMYVAIITGSGFLWHQIRCLIGVLFLIGQEREEPEVIKRLLDVETNPCKPDYNMASEIPLNLFACEYDVPCGWQYNTENLEHVLKKLKSMWTLQSTKTTMMKSMLLELENLKESRKNQKVDHVFTECLLQGSRTRKYVPLMERQRGESLDNRIKQYKNKKRKLNVSENS